MKRIEADWLTREATQTIFALLSGHQCFAVGGCVRNTILDVPVHDIDIATSAHPDVVLALAEQAGLQAVPTGIDHGTVTVVVEDEPYEITTFRRDVATDGRRAVVAFSDDIGEDARRRDFTINAIYAAPDGSLWDPVGGLPDLAARRIRFIEDADRRIREDFLRSLRFFRFHAWYGDAEEGFDAEALDAIARNLDGLASLSKERVGSELVRLLGAPDPAPSIAGMRVTGVLARILPGADDTALGLLVTLEAGNGIDPDGLRRLAVLGGDIDDLRLSKKDISWVTRLRENIGSQPEVLAYRHGQEAGQDLALISAALLEQKVPGGAFQDIKRAASAVFPVNAADLMPELEGKALGDELRRLEELWIASGFALSREALLSKG